MNSDRAVRLRKLKADLTIKTGDLKVAAGKLRRAQDYGRIRQAMTLQAHFDKIKETIADVRKTIADLEAEEVQDELPVAG